jgi:hypothetical protein
MAGKIIGRFYFKQTANRNLVGEFSNNHPQNETATESADLIEGAEEKFVGKYNSTWQENGKAIFANLTISRKPTKSHQYFLEWKSPCNFRGEGMLCDDILIGNYWEV